MGLPGTTITLRDSAPPRSAPTDSSVWLVVGMAERGALEPIDIFSMADYATLLGDRVSYGFLYDALDVFFREGGSHAIVSRVAGADAAAASHDFEDGAAAVSLHVEAASVGAWGDRLKVAVIAGVGGGTYRLQVSLDDVIVETSTDLTTQQDAVDWSTGSSYVVVTLGVSEDPPAVVAATALSGGDDDHANAVEADWTTALGLLVKELGPGQVSMPGRTTDAAHQNLVAHAAANNRVALVDFQDTADRATLVTAAGQLRGDGGFGAGFAPWAVVPGITGTTTRTVPYSAVQAGIIARNDSAGDSPNQPAAGENGQALYATGLSQPAWSDADREALNDAGVNVARIILGGVRTYGYRTLADPNTQPTATLLSNSRLVMEITAECEQVAERHMFRQIDGQGVEIGDFAGDLIAVLMPWYNAGSLYGDSAATAFVVDVGNQVNTPQTIAAGQLNAQITLRLAPFGEQVRIFITKTSITEAI